MENNGTCEQSQENTDNPITPETELGNTIPDTIPSEKSEGKDEASSLVIKTEETAAAAPIQSAEKSNAKGPAGDGQKSKEKSPTPQKDVRAESATPPPRESTPQSGNIGPPILGKVHKPTRGKREDKEMRREVRFLEETQKKITGSSNDDQMLLTIIKKYQSMYDELKKNETTIADWQASYSLIRRERDAMTSENQRLLMRVGKTEALCRLQQQQNKQTKDEYVSKLREEQEKRKEVTCKLHETLKQLDVVLNENSLRSTKLHEENIDMSQKLSRLHQQINKRSEETRSAEKQLELQKQLYTTEISKNRLEHEAEKEIYLRQVELLQYQLQEKETEIKIQKNELATMESRVDEYIKKYADIEPFISQSSKLFETYKGKIETMNATNSSLETEVFDWQRKYNDCMRNVVDLTVSNKIKEKDVAHLQRKLDRLQNLCRQLQTDRSNFLKQLKTAGIEPGDVAEQNLATSAECNDSSGSVLVGENGVSADAKTVTAEAKTVTADEKSVPVDEKTVPVDEKTVPVEEKTVPIDEKTIPVTESKILATECKDPTSESKDHHADTADLASGSKDPHSENSAPISNNNVPVSEQSALGSGVGVKEDQAPKEKEEVVQCSQLSIEKQKPSCDNIENKDGSDSSSAAEKH